MGLSTARVRRPYFLLSAQVLVCCFTASEATAIVGTCGGKLVDNGMIASPGYPGVYSNYENCVWTLKASFGMIVHLEVLSFVTETKYDYIQVYSSSHVGTSSLVGKYMGTYTTMFGPINLSEEGAVWFVSDLSKVFPGFLIAFTSVSSPSLNVTAEAAIYSACGGKLISSGSFTSPNYAGLYPANANCTWILKANPGQIIKLTVTSLDLETDYDFLYVYNSTTIDASCLVQRYTGVQSTSLTINLTPVVAIVFTSDYSFQETGVDLQFTSVTPASALPEAAAFTDCGGKLTSSGNLTSPNYPESYPMNANCTWILKATLGQLVMLTFTSLDLETDCDFLYLYNSSTTFNASTLVKRYTGTNASFTVNLTQEVAIVFTSDYSFQQTGFSVQFTSAKPKTAIAVPATYTACGGKLTSSGSLTSPNYPGLYPMNANCSWILKATSGQIIELTITSVNLETDYDLLYVYNSSATDATNLVQRFTGQNVTLTANLTQEVAIVFTSDISFQQTGFSLQFTSVTPGDVLPVEAAYTACGGKLASSGNLSSPNYPGSYPMNANCTWILKATPGQIIKLTVTSLDLETGYDFLYIYNSSTTDVSYLIHRYTGKNVSLTSNLTQDLAIVFTSDYSFQQTGFSLKFTSVTPGAALTATATYSACGGKLTSSGSLASPNYPGLYPMNANCSWIIKASSGQIIKLNVTWLDLESGYDFLYVYNSSTIGASYLVRRYTGQNASSMGNLTHEIAIVFTSDYSFQQTGFSLQFTSVTPVSALPVAATYRACGGNLTSSGNLTSPAYPGLYPMNSNCTWILKATLGQIISLNVISFDLETDYDFLDVYNSSAINVSNLIQRYTGENISLTINLKQEAAIVFTSDYSFQKTGFSLQFTSATPAAPLAVTATYTACGGSLTGQGSFQSPGYPATYPANANCSWSLHASSGCSIVLTIVFVSLEDQYDYLSIYNVSSVASISAAARYTGTLSNFTVALVAEAMVVFSSDASFQQIGFNVTFYSQPLPKIANISAAIVGGPYVNVLFGSVHTFDAARLTIDRSMPGVPLTGGIFIWQCRRLCENWTLYDNSFSQVITPMTSDCNDSYSYGLPGCFMNQSLNDGTGTISQNHSGVLTVNTSALLSDKELQLRVIVMLGSSVSVATQMVTFVGPSTPTVVLSCISNCKASLNPNEKIALAASCPGFPSSLFFWEWIVYRVTTSGTMNPEPDGQWLTSCPTGKNKPALAISAGYWRAQSCNSRFTIAVRAHPIGVNFDDYGVSYFQLEVASPPVAANCSVDPPNGMAISTRFNITCGNFSTSNPPLSYQIGYSLDGITLTWVRSDSTLETIGQGLTLPNGMAANNFSVQLAIKATDNIGMFATTMVSVQVNSPSAAQMSSMLSALSDASGLSSLGIDPTNSIEALPFVGAVSLTLNDIPSVGQGNNTQVDRLKLAAARGALTSVLVQTAVADAASVIGVQGLLGNIFKNYDQVNADTCSSGAEVLAKSADAVANLSKDSMSDAQMSEALSTAISSAGSLLVANKYSSATSNATEKDISGDVTLVLKTLADASLLKMVAGENDVATSTSTITMIASKKYASDIGKGTLGDRLGSGLTLPEIVLNNNTASDSTVLNSQVNVFYGDYFITASNMTKVDSSVIMATLSTDSSGSELNTDHLQEPVHVISNRPRPKTLTPNLRGTAKPFKQIAATVHKIQLVPSGSMHLTFDWFENTSARALNESTSKGANYTTDYSLAIFMSIDRVPRVNSYDFNCTLPVIMGVNRTTNETVIIRGGVYSSACYNTKSQPCSGEHLSANLSFYPRADASGVNVKACYLPASLLDKVPGQVLFATVHYIPSSELQGYLDSNATVMAMPDQFPDNTTLEYEAYSYTQSCSYWNPSEKLWKTDFCLDGPLTSLNVSHCLCSRLSVPWNDTTASESSRSKRSASSAAASSSGTASIAFGSGLTLSINTVNLSDSAFNHLDDNPLLFSVLISIISIYLCSLVWAIKMDRLDAWKSGARPLLDNNPSDKYLYEVIIYTGNMHRAGTTAKVCVIFGGDGGESLPRLFCGRDRRVFQRGGVDSFVMAVPKSLGSMTYIRVWHDNTGAGPSWFLSRVVVTDLQTSHKFFFIVNKWLSASDDDCQICRVVNVAGRSDMTEFATMFWIKARKDLLDGHLWFSVVGKPHMSHFTREQRCTCCITLLFSLMTANIMFFNKIVTTDIVIQVGPIALSIGHVLQGLIASLVVLPINVVIVQLFRNSEPMQVRRIAKAIKNKVESGDVASQVKATSAGGSNDDNGKANTLIKSPSTGHKPENSFALWKLVLAPGTGNSTQSHKDDTGNICPPDIQAVSGASRIKRNAKTTRKRLLPWWGALIGYALCLVTCAVSFWYVVEIGNVLGIDSATKWLIAFVSSVIESVCLSQPIKVILKVVFFSLIIKRPAHDDESVMHRGKRFDYLNKLQSQSHLNDNLLSRKILFNFGMPTAPTKQAVQAVERLRERHRESLAIVKEVIVYMVFVVLMMMASYGNIDVNSERAFRHVENHVRFGLGEQTTWLTNQLDKAHKYETVWGWLSSVALPFLYASKSCVKASKQFEAECRFSTFSLINQPRIRQIRLKQGQECSYDFANRTQCFGEYYGNAEDSGSYGTQWSHNITETEPYAQAWRWNAGSDSYAATLYGQSGTYSSSGFAVDLGSSLEMALMTLTYLQNNSWLDQRTRAVAVEFAVYNPNVNLVAVSFVLIEFLPIGVTRPTYSMVFIRYEPYERNGLMATLVAEIGSLIFFMYFAYNEFRTLKRLKKAYTKSLTNILNMVTLLLCLVVIVMFTSKVSTMEGTKAILETKSDGEFLNFQSPAYWSECYRSCLGLTTFVVTLKFLRLLRFNNRISMLGMTLKLVMKSLVSFLLVIMMVVLAFAHTTVLIFGSTLGTFSTFLSTCQQLFLLMLNKFDYVMLQDANYIYAPIFILGFVTTINFMMLNVMITIIMEGFQETRQLLRVKKNKREVLKLVVDLFKTASGLGAPQQVTKPIVKLAQLRWRNLTKKKAVVIRHFTALEGEYAEVFRACQRFEKVVDNFVHPHANSEDD